MAIKFLTGLDVTGNVDLNQNQLVKPRIENLSADPAGVEGQIYFNTSTNKLKLYADGAWTSLEDTGSDDNTTYELFGVGSTNGTAGVQLDGSDGTLDNVLIVGAGSSSAGILVTRASNTLTVTTDATTNTGTVESVGISHGGNAFTTGSAVTTSGTLAITMAGSASQYIDGAGNLTTFPAIPQGDITGLTAGAGISITNATGPVPTITNALPFNELTLAGSSGTDTTISDGDTISILAGSNISAIGNGGGGVTISYTGGTGTMSSFNLDADTGSGTTVSQGNVVDIAGGTYATTNLATVGITRTLTVNVDGTTTATASKVVARDGSGYGYVVTPASGDSSTKIATTAFVQSSLTGLLEFKGGFNANTGAIVGGGNLTSGGSRVAVAVGDYYVVTVAGNFFGNTATPLTPGDSVIVQTAAAVGTSVEGDFIVVQSDTDLATNSTVGLMYVNPTGTGISSNTVAGVATLTNTSPNIVQDLWKTINGDTGGSSAGSPTATLTIAGSGSVSTAMSGGTLTITGTNTTYTTMTTSTLGLGKLRYTTGSTPTAQSQTTTANRTYGVTNNASGQLVVNVPWVNDDTGLVSVVAATGSGQTVPLTPSISGTQLTLTSNVYGGTNKVGYVPSGGTTSTFLKGNGTWATPTNTTYAQATESTLGIIKLSTDALALAGTDDLTAVTPSVLASTTYTSTFPAVAGSSWTIAAGTHGLGTSGQWIIQTYIASTGEQVFLKTTANPSSGLISMSTSSSVAINYIRVVMSKVW
jgi:molybdopterin converting factor small subunit